MKRIGTFAAALLGLALLFAMTALGEEYTYTVRIFAGAQGTIDGAQAVTYSDLHYGDRVNFDIGRVRLNNDSKYYVRGIRESGRDNETVAAPSIRVTGDLDYVVAYGIRGSTVAYTVHYKDRDGSSLIPSATYYGNVGDKPVVACQYIEGYQPQAFNLTKTLGENAADNVFTFLYNRVGADGAPGGEPTAVVPGAAPATVVPGAPTVPGTEPEAPPPTAAPGTEPESVTPTAAPGTEPEAPAGDAQQPAEIEDLDDNPVPLAPGTGEPEPTPPETPAMPMATKIAIGFGVAALAGAAALPVILRRKKKEHKNHV